MVGVENHENARRSLENFQKKSSHPPEMIVTDFAPGLLSAVNDVFGPHSTAIDPFHVMQELNRAIDQDLVQFRKIYFSAREMN